MLALGMLFLVSVSNCKLYIFNFNEPALFSTCAHIIEEVEFTCIEDHEEDTEDRAAVLAEATNGVDLTLEPEPKGYIIRFAKNFYHIILF